MAASVDIVYRKDKVNGRNEGPLHIRIIKNRKVKYLSTGCKLESKYWDNEKRKVKSSYPNSVRLNNYLNTLKVKYQDEVLKHETANPTISTKQLKNKITGSSETDFFLVARLLLDQYQADNKFGTYRKACSIVEKFKKFARKSKFSLEDITPTVLGNYEKFLKTELKNKINTINKDLRFIRRVFNEAYRMDLISMDKSPFNRYILKTEKTSKTYLTEKELLGIEGLTFPLDSKIGLHRDMFVFSAYCGGFRISDVLNLKAKDFDGSHIHLSIQKTKAPMSIKIPNKALNIIQKYAEQRVANSFIFPVLSIELKNSDLEEMNRKVWSATAFINNNLKVIARMAGIEKNISFHTARHTWATLALRKGISIDKVSKLMGHAAIKETQIYAKIVNEELDKAMEVFNA